LRSYEAPAAEIKQCRCKRRKRGNQLSTTIPSAIAPGVEFDHVSYDSDGDVHHLRRGEPQAAADTLGSPEGHAVRLDDDGDIIGITIVNAKWLVEHNGKITITVPT
jgi:uncharacterized protein YuzE